MKTVYHPTLPTTQDVSNDALSRWLKSGWLEQPHTHSPAAKPAADKASDHTKGKK